MEFNDNEFSFKTFHKEHLIRESLLKKDLMFLKVETPYLRIEKHPGYVAILQEGYPTRPMHIVETYLNNKSFKIDWDYGWEIIPNFHGVIEGVDEFGVEYIKVTAFNELKNMISHHIYYSNGKIIRVA